MVGRKRMIELGTDTTIGVKKVVLRVKAGWVVIDIFIRRSYLLPSRRTYHLSKSRTKWKFQA